jgi:hypothetical protein
MVDLFQPVLAAPPQHVAAVIQKGAQNLFQAAHFRHAPVDQHVHVQAEPRFKVRILEQRRHQHIRFDRARARLKDDADIISGFVPHIGQKRDFLGLDKFGQLFDQLGFRDLIGNLGDDNLPGPTPQIFNRPFRAGAE